MLIDSLRRRPISVWTASLLICLILLWGRYDWHGALQASAMGYACSAFFIVILLPVVHYTARFFLREGRGPRAITIVLGFVLTLPYRWLGLDRFSINSSFPVTLATPGSRMQSFDWFPGAFHNLPAIPHEGPLFIGLTMLGVLAVLYLRQRHPDSQRLIWAGLGLWVLILVETWLHLSLRSPLTYAGSLHGPNAWPVYYLFPGERGAVNGDYPVHRAIEALFLGLPGHLLLARRAFYYYISSQASYFINPHYVGLVLNTTLWFAAVISAYGFMREIHGERVARITAVLVASGTGFIYYVAQPMSYMAGYALCIILIFLFERIVVGGAGSTWESILFGGALGLASLVYEGLLPVYVFIVGFGLLSGVPVRRLLAAISVALVVYFGFILLLSQGLRLSLDPAPFVHPANHIADRLALFRLGRFDDIYILLTQFAVLFFGGLTNAFLVVPMWLALGGMLLVRGRQRVITVLLLLAMPFSWTLLFHTLGVTTSDNSYAIAAWPRYLYIGYPAIYLLDAILLSRLADHLTVSVPGRELRLGRLLAGVIIGAIVLFNSLDVWGLQSPYYLFYFLSPTLAVTP